MAKENVDSRVVFVDFFMMQTMTMKISSSGTRLTRRMTPDETQHTNNKE
eukprot:gene20868-7752_t